MLTDAQCRTAKPREAAYRLTDGGGLHLFVTPAGGKHWRLRYELSGKEKLLTLGPYPDVGLAAARDERQAAKALLRKGLDPAAEWKRQKVAGAAADATTFEKVAREWHSVNVKTWTPTHSYDVLHSLERDIFPEFGRQPITAIKPPDVLAALRKIESRPAIETAHRVRQRVSAVFVYAIASGRAEMDPAAIVQGALAPIIKRRQPAVTSLELARKVLHDAESAPAHPVTKLACRFLALTAVRPGELRGAAWTELSGRDGDAPLWTIPAARMKLRQHLKEHDEREHWVPLARQSVELLAELHKLTGRGPLLFPSVRNAHTPMSENAIGYMLNRAGYHQRHVPHGWRATFSTVMNERYPADRAVIELMLAHVPKEKVEAAYNRAAYLERRRQLAQEWADLLLESALPLSQVVAGARR